MKNVNELRVAAYAIVRTDTGQSVCLCLDRPSAREMLAEFKQLHNIHFKIVKLVPEKFVR